MSLETGPKRTPKGTGDFVSVTIHLPKAIHAELLTAATEADRELNKMITRALKSDEARKAIIAAGK